MRDDPKAEGSRWLAQAREDLRWADLLAKEGGYHVAWVILDGYYLPTRYPNSLPGSIPAHVYGRQAAQEAVALARHVVAFVAARMGTGEGGR